MLFINIRKYISFLQQRQNAAMFNQPQKGDKKKKKIILTLAIGLMAVTAVHAQQVVVIERPGILSDLASATGAIISLPLAAIEGVVVGAVEAPCSLFQGSTEVVVVPKTTPVSVPVVVASPQPVQPSTTIITAHEDGTITTVTRQASAYEIGPVILTPVSPSHRVGTGLHVNPYVYRPR